ncbi:MAG: hypothetical protein ACKOB8_12645 [Mycobacterium sp.]
MTGLADLALGAAPIAGGALLGVVAGNLKPPDFRGMITSDLEMLDMLPAEDVELRAALKASIDRRIRDLIDGTEKSRQLREIAASYQGNWRDAVLFICAVLFTVIWWNIPHSRSNWLVMFVFLIALTAVVGLYASRGVIRALRARRSRTGPQPER